VKARLATNDLVAALKRGGLAVRPGRIRECRRYYGHAGHILECPELGDWHARYIIALNSEPDWKNILAQFANALEQCGDRLPVLAEDACIPSERCWEARAKRFPA
jgi:hypothetical protein